MEAADRGDRAEEMISAALRRPPNSNIQIRSPETGFEITH
jgi:hypothetical protein